MCCKYVAGGPFRKIIVLFRNILPNSFGVEDKTLLGITLEGESSV